MNISIKDIKVWARSRKGETTNFEPASEWDQAAEIAAVIEVNGEPVIVFVDTYQYTVRTMGRWYPGAEEKQFLVTLLMKESASVPPEKGVKTAEAVTKALDGFMGPHVSHVDMRPGAEKLLVPGCGAFEYHQRWAYVKGSSSELARFSEAEAA